MGLRASIILIPWGAMAARLPTFSGGNPELIEGLELMVPRRFGITSGGRCITAVVADQLCSHSQRLILRCGT